CQLFAFRFPRTGTLGDLRARLERIVWGNDPLVTRVPPPARPVIRHYLQSFFTRMPSDFDLRGASLGNLVIAGGYLRCGRRMEPVIRRLSHLCAVRGTVRPVVNGSFHLVAQLQDGRRLVGQHLLTGKEVPPIPVPVVQVYLTRESRQDRPVEVTISPAVKRLIREAELICYPMGSFYSSLIANLLPRGVGEAIQENPCPKIYLPNVGADPEQLGLSLSRCVETLLAYLQRGCSRPVPAEKLLHFVLIDSRHAQAFPPRECARIRRMGIELLDRPLITGQSAPCWDEERLVPLLLSLLKER
ncbi:MAG: GAK system CofD-like protein, partial [Nitrospinota bacterium]